MNHMEFLLIYIVSKLQGTGIIIQSNENYCKTASTFPRGDVNSYVVQNQIEIKIRIKYSIIFMIIDRVLSIEITWVLLLALERCIVEVSMGCNIDT